MAMLDRMITSDILAKIQKWVNDKDIKSIYNILKKDTSIEMKDEFLINKDKKPDRYSFMRHIDENLKYL